MYSFIVWKWTNPNLMSKICSRSTPRPHSLFKLAVAASFIVKVSYWLTNKKQKDSAIVNYYSELNPRIKKYF